MNRFEYQGYPRNLIMEDFKRALEVDRTLIAPLVITFSPANPKFKDWIAEELPILHEEPKSVVKSLYL